MGGELGMSSWMPANWGKRFGTGTTPVNDPTAYPDKATLLDVLGDGQKRFNERLVQMSADDLSQPLPDARYRDRIPTVGHALLHILASHTAMHVGQMAVWRRAMGLPVVDEPLHNGD
jgi:hypothetical protein